MNELKNKIVIINSTELNNEAHENMYTFGISERDIKDWGTESINQFIIECRDLYLSKKPNIPMIFYSWFDNQAGQLRISMVSSSHNKLPFGSRIQECELGEMLDNIYGTEDISFFKKRKLKVWCTEI
ncbi:hypothetical protein [Marinicellulosiphila megalodicopiae]|uniref:hypothetical protein n=1 Tax=Marinicellulosiphila megalodicopiae TaxID=2724896 RepID=UPI003BB190F2